MSCNGCRILRKGCSENCLLRASLQCIDSAEAQAHATVFVAKFFGRAGLMAFLNNVLPSQRPAVFQSLLFEAAGRTINPVTGAAGLLWTNNWHLCQAAVDTVLRGGSLRPIPELLANNELSGYPNSPDSAGLYDPLPKLEMPKKEPQFSVVMPACDLDLCLTPQSPDEGREGKKRGRSTTPSMNSEGSVTISQEGDDGPKLLNLFV